MTNRELLTELQNYKQDDCFELSNDALSAIHGVGADRGWFDARLEEVDQWLADNLEYVDDLIEIYEEKCDAKA